jgi:hypothetical protein
MQRLHWRLLALLSLPSVLAAQSAPGTPVTIGSADSLWSPTLNEHRKFLVYTPPSYSDTTYLPREYPVLYLLDGDAHFHSVSGLIQILGTGVNATFVVPEMIVVAIPNTDRTRDLTPTRVEKDYEGNPSPELKTTGGMPNFFTFLKSELIPAIEAKYRTAPYRVFVGHSLGGIAAINALYTIPETFNAYVAIDPSLWYDNQLLLRKAKGYFSAAALGGRTLFVAQANTINPDDTTANVHYDSIVQFNSILESYNQSGLRYGFRYYADDSHGSVPLIAEYDALRFIFGSYQPSLWKSLDSPAYLREHFAAVSRDLGYRVLPPESAVDLLGQIQLMRDTAKALELFQMNAELYPASPHAYESLGAAWAAMRDTTRAIASYEKALALNPRDQRAREAIQKLRAGRP